MRIWLESVRLVLAECGTGLCWRRRRRDGLSVGHVLGVWFNPHHVLAAMSLLCLGLPSLRRIKTRAQSTEERSNSSGGAIAHGLEALPTEILLEIIAYTRAPDIPWPNLHPPDPASSERRKTILALSSICRSLRIALIPVLWETIEACTARGARVDDPLHKRNKRWWKSIYKSTLRQLEIVSTRQPLYASYVKYVPVSLLSFTTRVHHPGSQNH